MVKSTISSQVKKALSISLDFLLIQYEQSYMQQFVKSILSRDTHRPSGVKLWHIPLTLAEPRLPFFECLFEPEDEQDTSYLAAEDKILNFSPISILHHQSLHFYELIITHFSQKNKCSQYEIRLEKCIYDEFVIHRYNRNIAKQLFRGQLTEDRGQ